MSVKRFKKWAGFLPNAQQKKFGKKIARYFYRFPVFPLTARYVPVMQKITTGAIHEIPTWGGCDPRLANHKHRVFPVSQYYAYKVEVDGAKTTKRA